MFSGVQPKTLAPWPSPSLASATVISVPPTANGVEKLLLMLAVATVGCVASAATSDV
ncbi:hypothetical protein RIU76_06065 [Latilactobacillus sakei subsp. sakei]|nr:hypothetical protein [Latilactobacillus sakei]MDR7924289.1 hypothetical protein [Latilactobacillus sakei subsp. sakei]